MTMLHPRRAMLLPAITAVLLLGWQGGVHAQIALFPYEEGQFLVGADFDRADAAARRLLEPHAAPVGTQEAWAEPSTGNSGTLMMMRGYRLNGAECHTISWHDLFKDGGQRTVSLNTCRVDGQWKLMS